MNAATVCAGAEPQAAVVAGSSVEGGANSDARPISLGGVVASIAPVCRWVSMVRMLDVHVQCRCLRLGVARMAVGGKEPRDCWSCQDRLTIDMDHHLSSIVVDTLYQAC